MKIAVQMNELSRVDQAADSTFALMAEAARRGFALFYYLPQALTYNGGDIIASGQWVELQNLQADMAQVRLSYGRREVVDLRTMDVVLMRQDPPFDMAYITATHILEELGQKPLVVNNPRSVRNAPEKLFALGYRDLVPPTLISRDYDAISGFRRRHGDVVIKPLFGNGGGGVFLLKSGDANFNSLLEMFFAGSGEPIIVQKFLDAVSDGDKRIILCDGEPIGAINRLPPVGEIRSNMHIGGIAEKSILTSRDLEICRRLGADLKAMGLIFAGIDVIGDYLTEVNVTSPTGLQEMARFDGSSPAGSIWDAIEKRL